MEINVSFWNRGHFISSSSRPRQKAWPRSGFMSLSACRHDPTTAQISVSEYTHVRVILQITEFQRCFSQSKSENVLQAGWWQLITSNGVGFKRREKGLINWEISATCSQLWYLGGKSIQFLPRQPYWPLS